MARGRLYLIPCGLGGENEMLILPDQTRVITNGLNEFIVEREKTARHFLKRIEYPLPLNDLKLHTLNKHTKRQELSSFLNSAKEGRDIGLLSEAGCPAIADPGADIVALAHEACIQVVPLVGPSSILMALMASGMNGQSFTFHGYVPKDKSDRSRFLKRIEGDAKARQQSQIFMDTPFRNQQLFEEIVRTVNPATRVSIAREISTSGEWIKTLSVGQWKKQKPDLNKKPAVFVLM